MKVKLSIFSFLLLAHFVSQSQVNIHDFHSEFEQNSFNENSENALALLLASDQSMTVDKYTEFESEFSDMLDKLRRTKTRSRSNSQFLEKAFYQVHRKNLNWYENYVSFAQTLESKKYDCLTGTALYALILDKMEIPYKVLEFDFHIFLLAEADGKEMLIEATDPLDGFITDADEIERRIKSSLLNEQYKDQYYRTYLQNEINLVELAGLQYYNLAVDLFNKKKYKEAKSFIKKANVLYPSERIQQTARLITSASL
ncbi:MAG: hypothetical protein ABJ004_05005 [Cyclobacteriaceae bacterium]